MLPVTCTDRTAFPSFHNIDDRLKSFEKTHVCINSKQLALAGFFFASNTVKCFYCGVILPMEKWTGVCVFIFHEQESPCCDYMRNLDVSSDLNLTFSGVLVQTEVLTVINKVT